MSTTGYPMFDTYDTLGEIAWFTYLTSAHRDGTIGSADDFARWWSDRSHEDLVRILKLTARLVVDYTDRRSDAWPTAPVVEGSAAQHLTSYLEAALRALVDPPPDPVLRARMEGRLEAAQALAIGLGALSRDEASRTAREVLA